MHAGEKSDNVILPWKPPNKGKGMPAERVEGRMLTKGNRPQPAAIRTQRREIASSDLWGVREAAERDKTLRFTALLHHVTPALLRQSFNALKRDAAPGIDGMTWATYNETLEPRLQALHERVHKGSYRAKPARRVLIPKADGTQRPLSILCLEDKIVQQAIAHVLNAVYEVDFLGFSYGFRSGRSQHHALDALKMAIQRRKVNWVLDLDIQTFFDAVDHDWLIRMVEHRIGDRRIVRLIRKWLTVGIVEDNGHRRASERGVPQGAVISPLLANVFLHYIFDLWTHRWRKRSTSRDIIVIRYADDAVVGFESRSDALRYQQELAGRLSQFGLMMHPRKTRMIEFGRFAGRNRRRREGKKPETFNFLGFTHLCTTSRYSGGFEVGRMTMKKRLRAQLRAIKVELRRRLHRPIKEVGSWLRRAVTGHLNYYAVPGNGKRVSSFVYYVRRLWLRSLRRRSQRTRMTWARFTVLASRYIPSPRIVHPYANVRFDAMTRGRSPVR